VRFGEGLSNEGHQSPDCYTTKVTLAEVNWIMLSAFSFLLS